jgi:hypothetical protein
MIKNAHPVAVLSKNEMPKFRVGFIDFDSPLSNSLLPTHRHYQPPHRRLFCPARVELLSIECVGNVCLAGRRDSSCCGKACQRGLHQRSQPRCPPPAHPHLFANAVDVEPIVRHDFQGEQVRVKADPEIQMIHLLRDFP